MSDPKLYVHYRPASVGDRLGWQECEEPYCGSFDRQGSHAAGEYVAYECGDCVDGWTPPAELVERMLDAQDRAESGWSGPHSGKWGEDQIASMRAVLLEQARWIGEHDS